MEMQGREPGCFGGSAAASQSQISLSPKPAQICREKPQPVALPGQPALSPVRISSHLHHHQLDAPRLRPVPAPLPPHKAIPIAVQQFGHIHRYTGIPQGLVLRLCCSRSAARDA